MSYTTERARRGLRTIPELARQVGRTPDVIRAHIKQGRIVALKPSREWLFTEKQWANAVWYYEKLDEWNASARSGDA